MHLTCGIDLVEVDRMKKAVEKWGERLLKRVFTDREIGYSQRKVFSHQHLAARFAAKEAVIKSLGQREINLKDIEVINDKKGKPEIRFGREGWRHKKISLSISHTRNYAIAHVIAYEE